ncbi:YgjP-like metallopeptidase domain-containing protein [uncultured Holdemanella sp.]|mgnify:FL=1|uniref:M48 family metallopeptidase n=1 Tax=uncultured Holdemanella sp. TaxID=1763549 RepID=UPI0025FF573F|nr:YgjP-like metallopeptidase domain-containing protein [uncultured Holdemanella sp.]
MKYVLHRKSNCKKIKIRVVEGVVCVSAPFTVSKKIIDDFVQEQEAWIKNQLDKNTQSKENDLICLLGNEYRLHYINQKMCYVDGHDVYMYSDKVLIQKFLKQNAKKYIDLRFEFFCEQLHIHDISLQYGFYKSKWGSCTPSKHKICFNVNLIFMPLEFIDAIILHELAHLYHLNHSKDFYDLLCTWMPNYKEIMKENKKLPIPKLY